jgi:large subunit ribosomal protein L22
VPSNTPLVAKASLRSIRVTPQKARRVVNMIRGQRADEALRIAKFSPQVAVSEDLYSLLNSAVANAKQKNPAIRDASELWVTEALVDEGVTMKRYRPRAQGRGYQILKRSSQISVVLSDDKNYRKPSKAEARKAAAAALAETETAEAPAKKSPAKKAATKKAPAKKAAAKSAKTENTGEAN